MEVANTNIAFKKAVKLDAKLRLAICGPAGSGKTYTMLRLAKRLAKGKKVAVVDTEHGSASKYSDLFEFDVTEPNAFDPRELMDMIKFCVENGYGVVCIDSLSHYWMGAGGELDLVDAAAKRSQSGNSFTAWKTVTPIHNALIDLIIGAKIHILVGMRTKTEWVIETNEKGKSTPRKIGLAPIMRDGIEFEFDVCGDMDQDNNFTITKTRCPDLTGKVINRPGEDMGDVLLKWLEGATPAAAPELKIVQPTPAKASQPATAAGPVATAMAGAQKAAAQAQVAPPAGVEEMVAPNEHVADLWKRMGTKPGTIFEVLQHLYAGVEQYTGGTADWDRLLSKHGAQLPKDLLDKEKGGGLRKVREFVAETYLFLERCQQSIPPEEPAEEPPIDPDDKNTWVPDIIGDAKEVKAEVVA